MIGASMNKPFQSLMKVRVSTVAVSGLRRGNDAGQTARLQLGQLDNLAAKASETVDVTIDERLMQLTASSFPIRIMMKLK